MSLATKHIIYTLSNPVTNEVFYVGVTSHPKLRKQQHQKKHKARFDGVEPIFTEIDFIHTNNQSRANQIERKWIQTYLEKGCTLINKRALTSPFPDNIENLSCQLIARLAVEYTVSFITIKRWLAKNDARINTPEAKAIIEKFKTAA